MDPRDHKRAGHQADPREGAAQSGFAYAAQSSRRQGLCILLGRWRQESTAHRTKGKKAGTLCGMTLLRAPDGTEFTDRAEYRKYLFLTQYTFKDRQVRGRMPRPFPPPKQRCCSLHISCCVSLALPTPAFIEKNSDRTKIIIIVLLCPWFSFQAQRNLFILAKNKICGRIRICRRYHTYSLLIPALAF